MILFAGLFGLLLALLAFGGFVGWTIAAIWLGGGVYMVTRSRSRGLFADTVFLLTWPIHLVLES